MLNNFYKSKEPNLKEVHKLKNMEKYEDTKKTYHRMKKEKGGCFKKYQLVKLMSRLVFIFSYVVSFKHVLF